MNTSEVLNRAADLIEDRGWTTGGRGWHPKAGEAAPVCAEGALRLANNGWRSQPAIDALSDYLSDRYPECFNEYAGKVIVFGWNDYHGRTASEVIEVLRACAVIEAARERQSVTA